MSEKKLRARYVAVNGEIPIKPGERLIAMEPASVGGDLLGWNVLIGPDLLMGHYGVAPTGLDESAPCPVCAERESEHE